MRLLWAFAALVAVAGGQVVPGRYVVELAGEPLAALATKPARERAAVGPHRLAIREEQSRFTTALEEAGGAVEGSLETVANALLVRMSPQQAERLAQTPGVRRVHPVYRVKLLLDYAVVQHSVDAAWNEIGTEHAGLGVKIGIVDTGIDPAHPAFQDPALQPPPGYPLLNQEADRAATNSKIIVARNYEPVYGVLAPDVRDTQGHGTGVAMAAAGLPVTGPYGAIAGVAPKAFLGSYKVFPGSEEFAYSDVILKAFEDAVNDGMDVVNLSLGSALASRPRDDIFTEAVERAASLGIIVVAAVGNEGPDPNTIGTSGNAPSAIGVGALENRRTFAGKVLIAGDPPYVAIPGDGPAPAGPVTAPMLDVATLDGNGLACNPFAPSSLSGRIAFILRGECFFETKLNNAQQAGAVAALVYTDAARPDPITMGVGSATLPGIMVSYSDGLTIKQRIAQSPGLTGTLSFDIEAVVRSGDRLASFSSRGPNGDFTIKPDLVAVGQTLSTATTVELGSFTIISGTSFSSPIVAGAAAVLKGARPALSARHYRSLLINSTAPVELNGQPAGVQQVGAGSLQLWQALHNTVTAFPTSLSFGVRGAASEVQRRLTFTNLSSAADTFAIGIQAIGPGPVPSLSATSLQLEPSESGAITLTMNGSGLTAGEYQGVLTVHGTRSEVATRIPYWFAVPSDTPAHITVLSFAETGAPEATIRGAIDFRVTDAAGVPITAPTPRVSVVSGGGQVLSVDLLDQEVPGLFSVAVRLGSTAGDNVFRIEAGALQEEVTITGATQLREVPQPREPRGSQRGIFLP